MIRQPPAGNPYLTELVATINAEFLRREPLLIGSRYDGTDWQLRFRASLAALWVQVHVQSTEAGEGGVTYDAGNFRSSTEVDCRSDRLQDVTVSGLLEWHQYVVWLVPVQYDGAGVKILYDGVDGRPDNMAFVDRELTGNRLSRMLSDDVTAQESLTAEGPLSASLSDQAAVQEIVTAQVT